MTVVLLICVLIALLSGKEKAWDDPSSQEGGCRAGGSTSSSWPSFVTRQGGAGQGDASSGTP